MQSTSIDLATVLRGELLAHTTILLWTLWERLAAAGAGPTATQTARLQAVLAQLKGSLDNWAGTATALSVEELQGLVELQTRFVEEVLDGELPDDLLLQVRSVQISPQFAQAVATVDPTAYNVVTLSDDLGATVLGVPRAISA